MYVNLKERKILLLIHIKEESKYNVIATNKNLGPAIVETEYYSHQYFNDHLDKTNTYKELNKMEACLLNDKNYRFICTHFIYDYKVTLIKQVPTFFIRECLGFTDTKTGIK